MKLVILAEKFKAGTWRHWKYICNENDIEAITDSAYVKAMDRANFGDPSPMDYLMGARYIFNVAYGSEDVPKEGDTRVYALLLNQIIIGFYERFERHFLFVGDSESNGG